ncbi:hypothetical protein F5Y02DRAFT_424253 [Annulohypoxylon stygium]|nr:hypothetical protein F5Y02DRAFT_424253 [Annulohypoxylon stygium]
MGSPSPKTAEPTTSSGQPPQPHQHTSQPEPMPPSILVKTPKVYTQHIRDTLALPFWVLQTPERRGILAGSLAKLAATSAANVHKHQPILILAPNSIVASQWVEEIESVTSERHIKQILVAGDGIQKKADQTRTYVLSAKEFQEWPPEFDYVWDRVSRCKPRSMEKTLLLHEEL